jgi:hypothetical protein
VVLAGEEHQQPAWHGLLDALDHLTTRGQPEQRADAQQATTVSGPASALMRAFSLALRSATNSVSSPVW